MKKVNVLQLIASLCLGIGSLINLLALCIEIPFALHICTGPLFMIAVVLYSVVLVKQIRAKKTKKQANDN